MKGGEFQTDIRSDQVHHQELGQSMNDSVLAAEVISPTWQIRSGIEGYTPVGPKLLKPAKEIRPGMETVGVAQPPWPNMLAHSSWCTSGEETHRLVRIRGAEMDTSVSALVRDYLRNRASGSVDVEKDAERRRKPMGKIYQDSDAHVVDLRMSGNLTREQLYDKDRSPVGGARRYR